jgi:hypothetical protein
MTTSTVLTGPIHPLHARIRDGHRARAAFRPVARQILDDHRDHAVSDQTVYRLGPQARFDRLGAYEDHRQVLTQDRHTLAVTGRTPVDAVADAIARDQLGDRLPGDQERAIALRDAAELAAPMVAVLLAVCVRAGMIEWDTGESVQAAARRLSLDAAWRTLPQPNPALPRPRDIFAAVADATNLVDRPGTEYAQAWLTDREEIKAALAEQGIRWGGPTLTAAEAAARASVAASTWRAYTTRQEAPAADEDGRWYPATVDAWRITRAAPTQTMWWG